MLNQRLFSDYSNLSSSPEDALYFLLKESFISSGLNNWKPGYVFIADRVNDYVLNHRSYRSFKNLYKHIEQAVYFTPNTFYRNDRREKSTLRWLNSLFIDLDDTNITVQDIFDKCDESGLPVPTLINKTPHGYHVFWKIEPVWATPKAIGLYNVLTEAVSKELGSDPNAIGGERYVRIPNNISFFEPNIYTLKTFLDWRDINQDVCEPVQKDKPTGCIRILPKGILGHPAFKKILMGYDYVGDRDYAAFTLALAMKVEGYSQEQAFEVLADWNKSNTNEKGLTIGDLRAKIKSAYSGKYSGPSSKWVYKLSGIPFFYNTISTRKTREERKYLHLDEIKQDIIALVKAAGGKLEITQAILASEIKAPLRSVKKAILALKEEGLLYQEVSGQGRAAKTIYKLLEPLNNVVAINNKKTQKNKQNKSGINGQIIFNSRIFGSGHSPPMEPETG